MSYIEDTHSSQGSMCHDHSRHPRLLDNFPDLHPMEFLRAIYNAPRMMVLLNVLLVLPPILVSDIPILSGEIAIHEFPHPIPMNPPQNCGLISDLCWLNHILLHIQSPSLQRQIHHFRCRKSQPQEEGRSSSATEASKGHELPGFIRGIVQSSWNVQWWTIS